MSLTANKWQNHPIVTGSEAQDILGINCLRRRYFKDPKGHNLDFGIGAVAQEIKQLQLTQRNVPVKKELLDCPFSSLPISAPQTLGLCTLLADCM